jgi:hypothetical protein
MSGLTAKYLGTYASKMVTLYSPNGILKVRDTGIKHKDLSLSKAAAGVL